MKTPLSRIPEAVPCDGRRTTAMLLSTMIFLAAMVGRGATPIPAPPTPAIPRRYQLLPDSYLINDCPPCARPAIPEPLRGTFDLKLIEENPLFSRYALQNIAFTAGSTAGRIYKLAGKGTYTLGGELALVQDLSLELSIDNGVTNQVCFLTNASPHAAQLWPIFETSVAQTNGAFTQVYQLHLLSAPFREIWFSTASGMTPGILQPPTGHISGGDLLSSDGHVVKSNRELTQRLGFMPSPAPPDLGLDALNVLPGGEVVFSVEKGAFSELLGQFQEGDLLSNAGRMVRQNQQLIAAFIPMPPAPDVGLDAVQVLDTGEVLFSIKRDFFSEALGRQIRRGDLLSSRGFIVKSNEQLLARVKPIEPRPDYGLDAVYVWPSGEAWFSVEKSFQGQDLKPYGHGDLLSDQGYVVARNLELVGPFQPLEDLADFGLDGLFIVSDAVPLAPAPSFTRIDRRPATGTVELQWEGKGRVWQVLRASSVLGPWSPLSPIIADRLFDASSATANASFYRLQQW